MGGITFGPVADTETETRVATAQTRAPSAIGPLDIGIHPDIPEAVYHADPAIEPSASSSILKTLIDQSPMHARWDHPRLNPAFEPSPSTDAQNAGSILHWHMTEAGERPYRPLPFDGYRTDKAKAARAETIEAGLIPILEHKLDELLPVADALRDRIAREFPNVRVALDHPDTIREATLIWREHGALCRCRFDVLPPAHLGFTLDFKFTGRSAEPEGWGRTLVNNYLFQAALYPRGVAALRGDRPEFIFLACETEAPYGVSLHGMDHQLEDLADRKLNRALEIWSTNMKTGEWPGYATETHYHEPPPWELARWEARAYRESITPGETYERLRAAANGPPR